MTVRASSARAARALWPVLALVAACSSVRHRSGAPRIDGVSPDSVSMPAGAVVEVVIRGRGFEPGVPGRNTVQFGDATFGNVPASADGTQIRFVIPDRVPLRGEAAPMPLETGPYAIRVQTANGLSNAVTVKVRR